MKAGVGKITFYSFSYRYIINKLRVFNAVRLSAAPPKIKCNIEFFRKLFSDGANAAPKGASDFAELSVSLNSLRKNSSKRNSS